MTINKRDSEILKKLRANKDPLESRRTRTSMLLSYRIVNGLRDKGWNRVQFANEMGKNPSVVTKWLSGTHNFTSDTLSDIEAKLNIKLLNVENEEITPVIIFPPSIINININIYQAVEYSELSGILIQGSSIGVQALSATLIGEN